MAPVDQDVTAPDDRASDSLETFAFPLLGELHQLAPFKSEAKGFDRQRNWRRHIVSYVNPQERPKELFWMDYMLGGNGWIVPKNPKEPLVVLVSGPPGSGKSLFTQQLLLSRMIAASERNSSVYVTSESSPDSIRDHLLRMHYPIRSTESSSEELRIEPTVYEQQPNGAPRLIIRSLTPDRYIVGDSVQKAEAPRVSRRGMKMMLDELKRSMEELPQPYALVFDSINTLSDASAAPFVIESLRSWKDRPHSPRLVIIVFDTTGGAQDRVDYKADVIISLSNEWKAGYKSFYLEIQKARFQSHVHGRHPYRIYSVADEDAILTNSDDRGPRPVLREGGIFVFPNHHLLLDEMRQPKKTLRLFTPHRITTDEPAWPVSDMRVRSKARGRRDVAKDGRLIILRGPYGTKRREFCGAFLSGLEESVLDAAIDGWAGKSEDGAGHRLGGSLLISFGESVEWLSVYRRTLESNLETRKATRVAASKELSGPAGVPGVRGSDGPGSVGTTTFTAAELSRELLREIDQRPGNILPAEFLNRITYWLSTMRPSRVGIIGISEMEKMFPQLHEETLFVAAMVELFRAHGIDCMIPIGDASTEGDETRIRATESQAGLSADAPKDFSTPPYALATLASYILDFRPVKISENEDQVRVSARKTPDGWHLGEKGRTLSHSRETGEWSELTS